MNKEGAVHFRAYKGTFGRRSTPSIYHLRNVRPSFNLSRALALLRVQLYPVQMLAFDLERYIPSRIDFVIYSYSHPI